MRSTALEIWQTDRQRPGYKQWARENTQGMDKKIKKIKINTRPIDG